MTKHPFEFINHKREFLIGAWIGIFISLIGLLKSSFSLILSEPWVSICAVGLMILAIWTLEKSWGMNK